jgi:hypothetical protein
MALADTAIQLRTWGSEITLSPAPSQLRLVSMLQSPITSPADDLIGSPSLRRNPCRNKHLRAKDFPSVQILAIRISNRKPFLAAR